MDLQHFKSAAVAALLATSVLGCAPTTGGDVVGANQAQTASRVTFGTITGSRAVTVQGNPGGPGAVTGTIAGGLAGGLLGNEIGGGRGQDIATVVGATAGAAAGNRVAAAAAQQQSIEWFVETDGGQNISVIQASPTFTTGQRVQIIQSGGTTRLAAS